MNKEKALETIRKFSREIGGGYDNEISINEHYKYVDLGIRYWGVWCSEDEFEDEEDDDFQKLSSSSEKKLEKIVGDFNKDNKCNITFCVSEKNWIDFEQKYE